ncbi:MAG: phage baseplate assembly protein V [Nitrosopumilus sp.]|nr:phage baseplate assembly protein V [Nitrosopumilus sp.]MDH3823487.1 phage baseplate assembly protein V [Nitrosopumilus sp.]MDH3834144.1 phage baseplate assembly protein V [Nitrosopumilus sp.]
MLTEIKENNKDWKYAWKIKVLKKFAKPGRYSHPQGAQRWIKKVEPKRGKKNSKGRTYFVSEVNDQVVVTFEHGDIKKPVIIGSTWNKTNKPPEAGSSKKTTKKIIKNLKIVKTRARSMKKSTSTKTKKI